MNKEELKEKYGKKRVPHEWRKTDWLTTLVVTFFGSGMSPKAPGTMGSLAAAIVAYPMTVLACKLFEFESFIFVGSEIFGLFINFFSWPPPLSCSLQQFPS